jgi:hypothetical protein
VNAELAALDYVKNLSNSDLAAVVNLPSRPGAEPTVEDGKGDGIEDFLLLSVEGAVNEDLAAIVRVLHFRKELDG